MTVTLSGNTFAYRDRLKEMGGRWDGTLKKWTFEFASKSRIAELRAMPGCLVTDDTQPAPAPQPRTDPLKGAMDLIERVLASYNEDTPQSRTGKTVFYGDDKQYYNCFKDRNPTSFMGFSSLARFVDWIEQIPQSVRDDDQRNAGYATGSFEERFSGTRDMEQAISLARNGWQEGIDNAAAVADLLTAGHALQRRRSYSVAGGNVSVGRLLSGNPAHMIRRPKQPGRRVITLFVQNNGTANISSKAMIVRSAICCTVIDLLEQSGFSCELISVTTDYMRGDVPAEHITVKLKDAGEKLNLPDIAFALGHPSFFRRFAFAAIGQSEELRDQWAGMGRSTEAFNSRHEPGRNEFFIRHLKNDISGDSMLDIAKKMLPAILPEGLPLELEFD